MEDHGIDARVALALRGEFDYHTECPKRFFLSTARRSLSAKACPTPYCPGTPVLADVPETAICWTCGNSWPRSFIVMDPDEPNLEISTPLGVPEDDEDEELELRRAA